MISGGRMHQRGLTLESRFEQVHTGMRGVGTHAGASTLLFFFLVVLAMGGGERPSWWESYVD